jgi:cytochrome P450
MARALPMLILLSAPCEHPSWLARVRESEPAAGEDLATRIILETLRLAQMEHVYREAVRDLRIGAFLIPKGWLVRICVRESHLDATVFPRPRTFDPDRHRDRVYAPSEFAPFGVSAHACLGQQLTRTVGRVFVSELAGAFECTIVQDAAPELSSWLHWHPSPALRLRLTRRTIAA